MSKELFLINQLQEEKGNIPHNTAAAVTYATILEAAAKNAYEGYYGSEALGKATIEAKSNAKAEQEVLDLNAEILDDMAPMMAVYRSTGLFANHSTSDFPLALQNLRSRTIRETYMGPDSMWREWVPSVITVPDFKNIRGLRLEGLPELNLRAEGESVTYASFGESEDGYRVSNYERADAYTWEMYKNDDVGLFTQRARLMGKAARNTEIFVILAALAAGLTRSVETGVVTGAPTIAGLEGALQAFTERTFTNEEGNTVEYGYDLTDIVFGTANRLAFAKINTQEYQDFQGGVPNVVRGMFDMHMERYWSRYLGTDYVMFDRNVEWFQVAFLDEFANGPLMYMKMPDVNSYPSQGSFDNHGLSYKWGHTLGAKVLDANGALRVEGA